MASKKTVIHKCKMHDYVHSYTKCNKCACQYCAREWRVCPRCTGAVNASTSEVRAMKTTAGGGGGRSARGGGGAMYHDIHRPQAPKIRIVQVRLNQGGYTSHGRYFGTGKPLYEVTYADSGDYVPLGAHWGEGFIRARDRDDAKNIVRGIVSDARF